MILENFTFILIFIFFSIYFFSKDIDDILIKIFDNIRSKFKKKSYEDSYHSCIQKDSNYENYLSLEIKFYNQNDYIKYGKKNLFLNNKEIFESNKDNLIVKINDCNKSFKIYGNHLVISGSDMINLLFSTFELERYKSKQTQIIKSLPYLPMMIYKILNLENKTKIKCNKLNKVYKKHIIKNEEYDSLKNIYHIINELYEMLGLKDQDMTVGITIGFKNKSNISNNVGIIILKFNKRDTLESLKIKFKENKYLFWATNTFLNIPIRIKGSNVRNKLDCIITTTTIKTDIDFDAKWFCGNIPLEKIYVAFLTQIKKNEIILHKSYSYGSIN